MLLDLNAMPDEAEVWPLVASRVLTDKEQRQLRALVNEWLLWWHTEFNLPASTSQVTVGGSVLVFAVDERPRVSRGILAGFSGSDLDPFWRKIHAFEAEQTPPLVIGLNEALIFNGEVIPFGDGWTPLLKEGLLSPQTLILHNCTVAEWRAGRLVHQLGDDPAWAKLLLRPDLP